MGTVLVTETCASEGEMADWQSFPSFTLQPELLFVYVISGLIPMSQFQCIPRQQQSLQAQTLQITFRLKLHNRAREINIIKKIKLGGEKNLVTVNVQETNQKKANDIRNFFKN